MRLLLLGILIGAAGSTLLSPALGQASNNHQLKHVTAAPMNARRPVSLNALEIERGVEYPSVVHLKGNVEIKTPVCVPAGKGGAMLCEGEMAVRADEAEFDEATGQIQAHGNVTVTPLQKMK
jgi:hypothetical protein